MRGDDGRAPDREELINSLATLKELQEMLVILREECEQLLNQKLTDRTRKTIITAHEAAAKLLKIANSLIPETAFAFDEFLRFQGIVGEEERE